ncbi:hypothetical protein PspLS_03463 [Pyricularia sp. CBS 133598]|nr:hypothetical protein PspLS_03463 [Pyricularia sp. CBS 133598]
MQLKPIFTLAAAVLYLAVPTFARTDPHYCQVSLYHEEGDTPKYLSTAKYMVPPGEVSILVGFRRYDVTVDKECKRTHRSRLPHGYTIETEGHWLSGDPTKDYIESTVLGLNHRTSRLVSISSKLRTELQSTSTS